MISDKRGRAKNELHADWLNVPHDSLDTHLVVHGIKQFATTIYVDKILQITKKWINDVPMEMVWIQANIFTPKVQTLFRIRHIPGVKFHYNRFLTAPNLKILLSYEKNKKEAKVYRLFILLSMARLFQLLKNRLFYEALWNNFECIWQHNVNETMWHH